MNLLGNENETKFLPADLVKMNIFAVQLNTFTCHICYVNHRCLKARSNATSVVMRRA